MDPKIPGALDIFSFLIDRCGENMNKRIRNVHISLGDSSLVEELRLAALNYKPAKPWDEFPCGSEILEEAANKGASYSTVCKNIILELIKMTQRPLSCKKQEEPLSKATFARIYFLSAALAYSRFLKTLIEEDALIFNERNAKLVKLRRRLWKICQYVTDIANLINQAKQLFTTSTPIHWVTDTFIGTGEAEFKLCGDVYNAVSRRLGDASLSKPAPEKVRTDLIRYSPSIINDWKTQGKIHARLHAELRIILYLQSGQRSAIQPTTHPIGVGKRSCFCCTLWIDCRNRTCGTKFMTSGSHGKKYALLHLQPPGRRVSDDYASSGDENDERPDTTDAHRISSAYFRRETQALPTRSGT